MKEALADEVDAAAGVDAGPGSVRGVDVGVEAREREQDRLGLRRRGPCDASMAKGC